jgi:hypothetical protein
MKIAEIRNCHDIERFDIFYFQELLSSTAMVCSKYRMLSVNKADRSAKVPLQPHGSACPRTGISVAFARR